MNEHNEVKPSGSFKPDDTLVLTGVTQENYGLLSKVLGQLDARRAIIISPDNEEIALQLLEALRKQGIDADTINNHPELQDLKEAWGGFNFEGDAAAWNQKISMSLEYGRFPDPVCCEPDEQRLIKHGLIAPKHHMHLRANGIPKQRGRKR